MKNKLIKNKKSEKGSVTLFVLIALIFFLIIGIFIFININNNKTSQAEEIKQIEKNYETTSEELEQKYEKITKNDA